MALFTYIRIVSESVNDCESHILSSSSTCCHLYVERMEHGPMVNDKKVENLCFVRNSFYLRHSIRQCGSIRCTSRVVCDCAFINVLLIGREFVLCSAGMYIYLLLRSTMYELLLSPSISKYTLPRQVIECKYSILIDTYCVRCTHCDRRSTLFITDATLAWIMTTLYIYTV